MIVFQIGTVLDKSNLDGASASASAEKAHSVMNKTSPNTPSTTPAANAMKKDEKKQEAVAKGGCCVIA